LRLQLGDLVGAEETAQALRNLDDASETADQVMASVLNRSGRVEESIDILEQVASNNDQNFGAVATLVRSYVQAGEQEKAEEFLDDIIARNPENVRALIPRAELHLLNREMSEAEELLKRIVEVAPDDVVGYSVLHRYYLQTGAVEQAEAVLWQGIERLPERDSERLRFALANLMETQGNFDAAIDVYEELYNIDPESLIVANNLVSLLAEFREDDAEAIAFAQRVSRRLRGSTVPHFLDTYGWVQFLAGDYQEALRSLRPAAEGLPENPLVRYHVGRAYAALGQVAEARGHLEASLAIDPAFPKAASARAALAELDTEGG